MLTKIFGEIRQRISDVKAEVISDSLEETRDIVRAKTPEDTGLLDSSWEKQEPQVFGDIAIGSVVNRTPYAQYVEHGISGRLYRYHKPQGVVFYKGQGVGMVKRSREEVRQLLDTKYKQRLSSVIRSMMG